MPDDTDPPVEESDTELSTGWPTVERRPLLKGLGAAATFSLLGSAGATAQETTTQRDDKGPLHPVFGQGLTADDEIPDGIEPAHVVELAVEEKEDIHGGFPLQPHPENPEKMVEAEAEYFFDPVGLHLTPGDVVHFKSLAHIHTVTAFHEKFGDEQHPFPTRVPEGVPGFTSPPIVKDESWLYEFSEPGVYDVVCLPHLGFGMVIRLVVSEEGTAVEDPAPPKAVPPNVRTVLTAPELTPQNIVENGVVGWSDISLEGGGGTETTTTT